MNAYLNGTCVFWFTATALPNDPQITRTVVKYGTVVETSRLEDSTQILKIEVDNELDEHGEARQISLPAAAVTKVT